MPEDALLDFEWESAGPGGYRWLPAGRAQLRTKTALLTIPSGTDFPPRWEWLDEPRQLLTCVPGAHVRRYKPLRDETGLFRIFAETKRTQKGIMGFAERYGLLGERLYFFPRKEKLPDWGEATQDVEKVHGWVSEIRLVADTMRRYEVGGAAIRDDGRRSINRRLEELVSPRLEWTADQESLQLSYVPKNLLGAIWLQLAFALGHEKQYPRCIHCKKPFEVSLDKRTGSRADAIFCSNKCKSADYRSRKRTARELAEEKLPLTRIAKKVRTDVGTVKQWIGTRATTKPRRRSRET